MPPISLRNRCLTGFTTISNEFIDRYMVEASGEYVKIYLYILRLTQDNEQTWTLATIAEKLDCTTLEVGRALKYWGRCGLLACEYNENRDLIAVEFLDPEETLKTGKPDASRTEDSKDTSGAEVSRTVSMPPSRMKELKTDPAVQEIVMFAEQYLGHPLSSTESETFLYFYDKLGFSSDLLDHLIDYCVSKGGTSLSYIKKVAFAWADAGVKTAEEAKALSSLHDKDYYQIMRAYGLSGRHPGTAEREFIRVWLNDYKMPLDVVLTAVDRTMLQIHTPRFEYTDSILRRWKDSGVSSIGDIEKLDAEHSANTVNAANKASSVKKSVKGTRFNNFEGRGYNYDELLKQLSSGDSAQ